MMNIVIIMEIVEVDIEDEGEEVEEEDIMDTEDEGDLVMIEEGLEILINITFTHSITAYCYLNLQCTQIQSQSLLNYNTNYKAND